MATRAPGAEEAGGQRRPSARTKRSGRTKWVLVAAFAVVASAAYFFWLKPALEMVTYEPVDQVNEIADWLIASDAGDELELLAGNIRARATKLEIPLGRRDEPALIEMVPEKFWRFEGQQGQHARLGRWIMLLPNSVSIHKPLFANGFHSIMIFDKAPTSPPEGFFGRIVGDRVFVVSYHCGRCSTNPAGHSREP